MKLKTNLFATGLLFLSLAANAQSPAIKELPAKRTTGHFKIDGVLDEPAWKDAPVMTDLVEFRPVVGRHESAVNKQLPTSCTMMKGSISVATVMRVIRTVSHPNCPGGMVLERTITLVLSSIRIMIS